MINYDDIDIEIRGLVRALNRVPGIETRESCHGHGKGELHVWLKCDSIRSLNKFLWGACHRFLNVSTYTKDRYCLVIDNGDTDYFSKDLRLCLVGPVGVTKEELDDLAAKINAFVDMELPEGWS